MGLARGLARAILGAVCAMFLATAAQHAQAQPQAQAPSPIPTKGWQAFENRMPGIRIEPGKTTLLIVGEVETPHADVKPVLRKVGDREGEADALELELKLQGSAQELAPGYRPMEILFIVPIYRYRRLYILHEGAPVTEQPIIVRPAY